MATTEMPCLASGGISLEGHVMEIVGKPDSATITCVDQNGNAFTPKYIYIHTSTTDLIYLYETNPTQVFQTANNTWFTIGSNAPIISLSGNVFEIHSSNYANMDSTSRVFVFGEYV